MEDTRSGRPMSLRVLTTRRRRSAAGARTNNALCPVSGMSGDEPTAVARWTWVFSDTGTVRFIQTEVYIAHPSEPWVCADTEC